MKTTDRMLEKIYVILEGYKSGDHICVSSLSNKLQRMDNRILMGKSRAGKLLSMYEDKLVVKIKGKWFKK